jgi:hypothetical protein
MRRGGRPRSRRPPLEGRRRRFAVRGSTKKIGALSGISRQNANQYLKRLEKEGLLRLEYGGVTILDLDRPRRYGE